MQTIFLFVGSLQKFIEHFNSPKFDNFSIEVETNLTIKLNNQQKPKKKKIEGKSESENYNGNINSLSVTTKLAPMGYVLYMVCKHI